MTTSPNYGWPHAADGQPFYAASLNPTLDQIDTELVRLTAGRYEHVASLDATNQFYLGSGILRLKNGSVNTRAAGPVTLTDNAVNQVYVDNVTGATAATTTLTADFNKVPLWLVTMAGGVINQGSVTDCRQKIGGSDLNITIVDATTVGGNSLLPWGDTNEGNVLGGSRIPLTGPSGLLSKGIMPTDYAGLLADAIATANFGSYSGNDTGWAGTKTSCYVDPATGLLYPSSTDLWDDGGVWDDGGTWDHWTTSYTYQTVPYDLGNPFYVEGVITVAGTFLAGTVQIIPEYSPEGINFYAWLGTQTGSTWTSSVRVQAKAVRLRIITPNAASGAPSTVSGYTITLTGASRGEAGRIQVPVAGTTVAYKKTYPVPPAIMATPVYSFDATQQPGMVLRPRITNITRTGFTIGLFMDDGTPMNGMVSYNVESA